MYLQQSINVLFAEKIVDAYCMCMKTILTGEFIIVFQAYFSQTTYHKSMLESKVKVYQKVSRSGSRHMDTAPIDEQMALLKRKFTVSW